MELDRSLQRPSSNSSTLSRSSLWIGGRIRRRRDRSRWSSSRREENLLRLRKLTCFSECRAKSTTILSWRELLLHLHHFWELLLLIQIFRFFLSLYEIRVRLSFLVASLEFFLPPLIASLLPLSSDFRSTQQDLRVERCSSLDCERSEQRDLEKVHRDRSAL